VDGDDSSIPGITNRTPLVDRLAVSPLTCEPATFEGAPIAAFRQRTFGGHLLAQAVQAASATVKGGRVVASLQAYFLRMGHYDEPLRYRVSAVRDGRSLSVRSVVVCQADRELATLQMMFAAPGSVPGGQTVSARAPSVPDPEALPPLHIRHTLNLPPDGIKLPTRANWATASRPLDVRYVDDEKMPTPSKGLRCFWFRAEDADCDQNTHRAVLTFASDRSLLPAIAKARVELGHPRQWSMASIDHTLWFHTDAHTGQWYLYVQESPFSTATTGFARGTIYDRDGRPVTSVAQHALMQR
jgi:acyl-CoA thioesterase-2